MATIYHIARSSDWPPTDGLYRGDTLETEGFIHCSTREQLLPVANRLFRGHTDLTVLVIDEALVDSEIIYENLEGGTERFPHIYGPLEAAAVLDTFALNAESDGTFSSAPKLVRYS